MLAAGLRWMLRVVLSPRRLLVAALLATFVYAAVVATKARVSPIYAPRPGKPTHTASARGGAASLAVPGGKHGG